LIKTGKEVIMQKKILLVDDDFLVLKHLRRILSTEADKLVLIGDAPNGKKALQIMEERLPDICVTDISMPIMNGIELIREAKARGWNVKFVVLSCHEEFDFLKDALDLGACDYLLKHRMKAQDMLEVIDKIVQLIDRENEFKKVSKDTRTLINQYTPIMEEKFVHQLISGFFQSETEVEKTKEMLNIKTDISRSHILLAAIHCFDKSFLSNDRELLLFSIMNIVNELINNKYSGICSRTKNDQIFIFVDFGIKGEREIQSGILELTNQIVKTTKELLIIDLVIIIGNEVMDFRRIPDNYRRLKEAMKNKCFFAERKYLFLHETENYKDFWVSWYRNIETEIKEQIGNGNHNSLHQLLNNAIALWNENAKDDREWLLIYMQLLDTLGAVVEEHQLSRNEVYQSSESPYLIARQFEQQGDLNKWVIFLFENACNLISLKKSIYRNEISEAISHMEKNISKNLTLNDVADHVRISRTHFSKVFKKETGIGFNEYYIKIKIDFAKKLLGLPGIKIYEVAEKTGFNDAGYFIKIFKETTGMTPKNFLKNVDKN